MSTTALRHAETYDNRRTTLVLTTSERELVRAAQGGDDDAFTAIVKRHERKLYGIALAIVHSPEDAEDVLQNAFMRAHQSLARFRADQPFGAWLHRIVVNAALDLRRRRATRVTEELTDTVSAPFRDPGESADLQMRLSAAVADLGRRQRSVLVLHDIHGFTHPEIGQMLGIPEGTARSLLHSARHSVRQVLGGVRPHL
jgi:RNA polymerase sigma-70 factor (ECF subfamily)